MPIEFKPIVSDITEANAKIKELTDFVNTLEQKIGSGGTTPSPVDGQLINLPHGQFWKTFKTPDFGKEYADKTKLGSWGFMGVRNNLVAGRDRPDPVLILLSYNVPLPNGSREFPTEAGYELVFEHDYPNPYGSGLIPDFEIYLRIYPADGSAEQRYGIYANKKTGAARKDSQAYLHRYMLPNGFNYANITDAYVELIASTVGKVVGFFATQHKDLGGRKLGIWNIGGTTFLQVPDIIEASGNTNLGASHIKFKLPSFTDDAAAKNGGLTVGESYWIKSNGKSVITKVEA